MNKKLIAIFILGVIAGAVGFYSFQNIKNASSDEAGKIAIDFINNAVKENNVTASLSSINEESGVYKFHLTIADSEYDSFITKDGRYLFSTAFDLKTAQKPEESSLNASSLEILANCIGDKGAKFYGAFWCAHCNNQKEMFGNAAELLPYIECSTPDGEGQLDVCKDNNVGSYPTWEFADGSRETGELSPEKLAEKTGCELPQ